jgi:hypothetical protein
MAGGTGTPALIGEFTSLGTSGASLENGTTGTTKGIRKVKTNTTKGAGQLPKGTKPSFLFSGSISQNNPLRVKSL